MNVLTTSQLTFYDMTDGDICFAIYSQGISDDGRKMVLRASVTENGEEITNGSYRWYKYDQNTQSTDGKIVGGFATISDVDSTQTIEVLINEDSIYRCDFSYYTDTSTSINVAYTAYYNMETRRMVYTECPSNGRYMTGDLWLVGTDYILTDDTGNVLIPDDQSDIPAHTMLMSINDGNGVYKSSDWIEAFDYNEQIKDTNADMDKQKEQIADLEQQQSALRNQVDWTASDGLIIRGGYYNNDKKWVDGNLYSHFTSEELAFIYKIINENGEEIKTKVAWISGDTTQADGHPQFYVEDAHINTSLTVGGETTVTQKLYVNNNDPNINNRLIMQAETNGSYSLLIDNT